MVTPFLGNFLLFDDGRFVIFIIAVSSRLDRIARLEGGCASSTEEITAWRGPEQRISNVKSNVND
jgi:hypothetical protein